VSSLVVSFAVVVIATSYVCTAVKEDEDIHLLTGTVRLAGVMALGLVGFAALVQLVTLLAG
jgi:hypothetical protein